MFTMKVRGIDETIKNIQDIQDLVNREAANIHILGATKFQTKAQENETAVQFGTLRRSIHTASPDTDHSGDLDDASKSESPADKKPIEKYKKFTTQGSNKYINMVRTFIGSWLHYAGKIHRDGGIGGKGQYFLRKAFNSERDNVIEFERREYNKLLLIGAAARKRL